MARTFTILHGPLTHTKGTTLTISTKKLKGTRYSISGSLSEAESLIGQARQILYDKGLAPTNEAYVPKSVWFALFDYDNFLAFILHTSDMGVPLELLPAVQLADGSLAVYMESTDVAFLQSTDGTAIVSISFNEDDTPTQPYMLFHASDTKGTKLN